jgi:hypothetical protein
VLLMPRPIGELLAGIQRKGQHAHHQALFRLRWMLRQRQRVRGVVMPVHVAHRQFRLEHRCLRRHRRLPVKSRRE